MIKILLFCVSMGLLEAISVRKPSTCSFPFMYKGQSYNDCIKTDGTAYWCSVEKVYNGSFSYCKVDNSDQIGDEHFLALIKRSEENASRLKRIQDTDTSELGECSSCIDRLKGVSASINEQSAIFVDQNKRLQGLKAQHNLLNAVVDKLNKYYQLRRCRQTELGGEYLGRVSVTGSGYSCQAWSSQTPNKHKYTEDSQYAENSVQNAANYCRNPGLDKGPWCYTTNPKQPFEYCHIPRCNIDCNIEETANSTLPLCDKYPSMTCGNGSLFYNNYCYKRIDTPMDFATAENTCNNLKGNLASVHTSAENLFIAEKVFPGKDSFFIGFTDEQKEGTFVWTDGSASDYTRFYGGEPNGRYYENCVEMGRYPSMRESWNDIPCSTKRPFVCKLTLN